MNVNNGALSFDAVLGTVNFDRGITNMERRVLGFTQQADRNLSGLENSFTKLGRIAAGAFAFTELAQLPQKIVEVRGQFQQLEIALNTMLQSRSKADKLMQQIVQTAATTPFGLKDLSAGVKMLLAYGSGANNVIGEIRMLGDVASGVSAPINDLIYLYGTLRTQGRAYAVDIRQFAGRGIPIYAELAKVLGVNQDKVNEFVEAGKVGFPQVEQAFKNMTSSGGQFGGLMEAQSKSLTGLMERLRDAIDVAFNEIGKANEGLAADIINGTTSIIENYQKVADAIMVIAATYGTYRAALALVNAMSTVNATTMGAVADAVDRNSGAVSREMALQVRRSQRIAINTRLAAQEAAAQSLAANQRLATLRAEVSAAAAKDALARNAARQAAQEITQATQRLAAAKANQVATAQNLSAQVRSQAANEVLLAQNALLAASENGVAARKAASATASDFLAKKSAVEAGAKAATTAATVANSTQVVANTAATNANAIASTRLTTVQGVLTLASNRVAAAIAAMNATLLANPIVAAATALVALAGAVWYLSDTATAAEMAQKALNDETERATQAQEKLKGKVSELSAVVTNDNATKYQQLKAYKELQTLFPEYFKNLDMQVFKTKAATDQQKLLNEAMDAGQFAGQNKRLADEQVKLEKLAKQYDAIRAAQRTSNDGGVGLQASAARVKEELEAQRLVIKGINEEIKNQESIQAEAVLTKEEELAKYEAIRASIIKQKSELEQAGSGVKVLGQQGETVKDIFNQIRITSLLEQLDQADVKIKQLKQGDAAAPLVTLNDYDKRIQQLKDQQKETKQTRASYLALDNEIKRLEKAKERITGPTSTKKIPERDKPQPFGSIAYYEQIARKADEILSKTPGTDTAKIQAQNKIKLDAERRIEEIRKQYAVKTFDEELAERKKRYEGFQQYVAAGMEKEGRETYAKLIKDGDNYADYLAKQIAALEEQAKRPGVGLIGPEEEQLVKLKIEYNDVTMVQTPLEMFDKKLEKIRNTAASLTDEIEQLKAVQASLPVGDMSPAAIQMRQQVQQQLNEANVERSNQLRQFVEQAAGTEERRLAIENKYRDMREALEQKYLNNKTAAYRRALAAINDAEKNDYNDDAETLAKTSKEWESFTKAVEKSSTEQTRVRLSAARGMLQLAVHYTGAESDLSIQALKNLRKAEEDHKQESIKNWGLVAGAIGEVGAVLEGLGGTAGEIGGVLTGVASQFGNVSKALNSITKDANGKTQISGEGWAAAAQAVVSMISTIIAANKRRREQEKAFALERIGFEDDYALALNKSKGQAYKQNEA